MSEAGKRLLESMVRERTNKRDGKNTPKIKR